MSEYVLVTVIVLAAAVFLFGRVWRTVVSGKQPPPQCGSCCGCKTENPPVGIPGQPRPPFGNTV